MQGSKYDPVNKIGYGKKDLNADYRGKLFTATKNTSSNLDFKVVDDSLVDGGSVVLNNAVMGDKISCQVVDVDNILGYGADTVLNQFVTDWYIVPGSLAWDFEVPYPAKIYAGLYIRVIYTSSGISLDVTVAVNYKLHKVLW